MSAYEDGFAAGVKAADERWSELIRDSIAFGRGEIDVTALRQRALAVLELPAPAGEGTDTP